VIKNNLSHFSKILILGIVLRLVFAATTFHNDLTAFVLASTYINKGEVITFYDQVRLLPPGDPIKNNYTDKIFNYQPLSYLIPSLFYLPFQPFIQQISREFTLDAHKFLSSSRPFEPVLILYKLPFIVFDLLCAFAIGKLAKDEKNKRRLQIFWLFNPVAIFVSSVMGQSDMMVVFFFILSLVAARENKPYRAVVFAAISALFKPAGLLLFPIIAVSVLDKSFIETAKTFLFGILTYLIGIAAYLPSISYRTYALFAEQTSKSTFSGITIASGYTIPWFFIAYTMIIILLFKKKLSLFNSLGLALASSLVLSHFHPQWFVWLTPWLISWATDRRNIYLYLAALLSWFAILLSFDYSLHLGAFWPLNLSNQYLFPKSIIWQDFVVMARAFLIAYFALAVNNKNQKDLG